MQGIIGLILVILGLVLIYDVVAGKAQSIVSLLNGQTDTVSNWRTFIGGSGSGSGSGQVTIINSPSSSNNSSNGLQIPQPGSIGIGNGNGNGTFKNV